jgi:hypothetical protein
VKPINPLDPLPLGAPVERPFIRRLIIAIALAAGAVLLWLLLSSVNAPAPGSVLESGSLMEAPATVPPQLRNFG